MKNLALFIKATLAGGFFVVLPVVLVGLLVIESIQILGGLVRPVAAMLPVEDLGGIGTAKIVAVLLLVVICLAVGLLMRTRLGARLGRSFERWLLMPVPGYQLIKSLSQRFAGADSEHFAPCLLPSGDELAIGFVVDEHENGLATVFVPWAPTPAAGNLVIVPKERLHPLDMSIREVLDSFFQYGVGSKELLGKMPRDSR